MHIFALSMALLFTLFNFITLCIGFLNAQECDNNVNFPRNSIYGTNRDDMLYIFPSNVSKNGGFYNGTIGQEPDKVYALGLCRGDSSSEDCLNCLNVLTQRFRDNCPYTVSAYCFGPGEDNPSCKLRYSNVSFFGRPEYDLLTGNVTTSTSNITSNMKEFDKAWGTLMSNLTARAAAGSSTLKFAGDNTSWTSYRKIYAAVQCTPDLSQADCGECLEIAMADSKDCCYGREGAFVFKPSCYLRWDLTPFLSSNVNLSPPSPFSSTPAFAPSFRSPPPNTSSKENGNGSSTDSTRTLVAVIIPVTIFLGLVAFCFAMFRRWKQKQDNKDEYPSRSSESLRLDFSIVRAATDEFSDANKLGKGGFGSVYKGEFSDGQLVAVKRLEKCTMDGFQEFKTEITLISSLKHKNLVKLLGFSFEGKERLLVYEFVPNGSLDRLLFDPIKSKELDWTCRYNMINGIARGILYLHEDSGPTIIHRDLKPGNILLDRELNPKISDFGMARLLSVDQSKCNTRRVAGTYGYMAPEYANLGHISVKTDVFSFGIMVLEIVSSTKQTRIDDSGNVVHLLSYAWKTWSKETPLDIVDQTLTSGSRKEILRCIHIGLLCVQENVARRPAMTEVVLMLNNDSSRLPSPSHPGFCTDLNMESDMPMLESKSITTKHTINEASITDTYPR